MWLNLPFFISNQIVTIRFVDCDMVMHFHGSGIGHKATWNTTKLPDGYLCTHDGENPHEPKGIIIDNDDLNRHETEEEDYGYVSGRGDDEDGDNEDGNKDGIVEEEDLGPEDGEEDWDDDEVAAVGFAELPNQILQLCIVIPMPT